MREQRTFPLRRSLAAILQPIAGSFSHLPAEIIGQDGCETMLPSNVATQRFQALQVVDTGNSFQLIGVTQAAADRVFARTVLANHPKFTSEIAGMIAAASPELHPALPQGATAQAALVVLYDITWLPVGHGLGQVLYSMPLAPCEQVNIAIIDWSRTDTASRQEQTGLTDTLVHDTLRDRTVS